MLEYLLAQRLKEVLQLKWALDHKKRVVCICSGFAHTKTKQVSTFIYVHTHVVQRVILFVLCYLKEKTQKHLSHRQMLMMILKCRNERRTSHHGNPSQHVRPWDVRSVGDPGAMPKEGVVMSWRVGRSGRSPLSSHGVSSSSLPSEGRIWT